MSEYKELLAFSIEYASTQKLEEFTSKFGVSLLIVDRIDKVKVSKLLDTVVVHLHGGGTLPYKVGASYLKYLKEGNLVTIGVYQKYN